MIFLEGKKRYLFDYEDTIDNVYDIRFDMVTSKRRKQRAMKIQERPH